MNSPKSVAITPIFQDLDNVPEYVCVNGEIHFLLTESALNNLQRICGTLQFISLALLNSQKQLEPNLSDLQSTLELPLLTLRYSTRQKSKLA